MHIRFMFVFVCTFSLFAAHAQHSHPGNPDSAFGVNGEVTTAPNGSFGSGINDIKITAGGKIVAAGFYSTSAGSQQHYGSALATYNPDGSLDNSFGINGIDTLTHSADTNITTYKVAFQSDGKLIVLAQVTDTASVLYSRPFVARLLGNGTVDSSFGINGKTYFSQVASYARYNISIDSDDNIIISGFVDTHGDYYLARLLANGTFDSSFGSNGTVSGQSFSYPMWYCGTVLSNGKILIGGQLLFRSALLARYNTNGTPDSTFGTNGIDTVMVAGSSNSAITSIAIQPDGNIAASGTVSYIRNNAYVSHNFIARYHINGGLDSSFAVNGAYADSMSPAANAGFTNIAVEGDGKIVAGGGGRISASTGYFSIVRHLPDGNFDSSFGTNGVVLSDTSSGKLALAMQATATRIFIAGSDGSPALWAIASYINDDGLLPVTLLKFSGTVSGNRALLSWSTANEINNRGFDIERSTDGVSFSRIGFVSAQYGSSVLNYTYTDNSLSSGSNYYRLKQVNNDGKYTYSNIISLPLSAFAWLVTGNPVVNNRSYVQLKLDHTATVSVQVVSVNGSVVQTIQKGSLDAGSYDIPLPMGSAAAGIYVVKLTVSNQSYTTKIVKR